MVLPMYYVPLVDLVEHASLQRHTPAGWHEIRQDAGYGLVTSRDLHRQGRRRAVHSTADHTATSAYAALLRGSMDLKRKRGQELRILRIPPLAELSLWAVPSRGQGRVMPIHVTVTGLTAGKWYSERDFLASLRQPAKDVMKSHEILANAMRTAALPLPRAGRRRASKESAPSKP